MLFPHKVSSKAPSEKWPAPAIIKLSVRMSHKAGQSFGKDGDTMLNDFIVYRSLLPCHLNPPFTYQAVVSKRTPRNIPTALKTLRRWTMAIIHYLKLWTYKHRYLEMCCCIEQGSDDAYIWWERCCCFREESSFRHIQAGWCYGTYDGSFIAARGVFLSGF